MIPAALGASLSVSTVCDPCNEWAGREIDQPFLADPLLREYRSGADQRDPRRGGKARRVTSQLLRGFTDDGDHVRFDHETRRPVMGSRILDLGDGRVQVRAGSEEEGERLRKRVEAKAAAEGKRATVESVERVKHRPTIKGTMVIRTDVWRREAAKIGLGVGSTVYPPSWRRSGDAHRLREWMHDRDRSSNNWKAPPLVPLSPPSDPVALCRDDEHLLFFTRLSDGATYLTVTLFGAAFFAVPVDTSGGDVPKLAWRLDWRHPNRDGATTWDELLLDAVTRLSDSEVSNGPQPIS